MIEAKPLPQEPENVRVVMVALAGAGVVVITAVCLLIAWWMVAPVPAPAHRTDQPNALEHGLYDLAGDSARARGERELRQYGWIDRDARVVRIPIDLAIEAVAAEPALLQPRPHVEARR